VLLEEYQRLQVGGKPALVRNDYLPERTVQTGLGDIPVKAPTVRDRSSSGIRFDRGLAAANLKRTKAMEEFIPSLYLGGISTADMQPALEALLCSARGLPACRSTGRLFSSIEGVRSYAISWLWTYNIERPNMAIDGKTPKQKPAFAA